MSDKRLHVLLVDDNESFRVVLTLSLMEDFEVTVAEDGQVAIEIWKKNHFDAIICDVAMPGIDGVEFAEAILGDSGIAGFGRGQTGFKRVPPLIVVTGMDSDDPRVRQLAHAPHVATILYKPVDSEVVKKAIKEACA